MREQDTSGADVFETEDLPAQLNRDVSRLQLLRVIVLSLTAHSKTQTRTMTCRSLDPAMQLHKALLLMSSMTGWILMLRGQSSKAVD